MVGELHPLPFEVIGVDFRCDATHLEVGTIVKPLQLMRGLEADRGLAIRRLHVRKFRGFDEVFAGLFHEVALFPP